MSYSAKYYFFISSLLVFLTLCCSPSKLWAVTSLTIKDGPNPETYKNVTLKFSTENIKNFNEFCKSITIESNGIVIPLEVFDSKKNESLNTIFKEIAIENVKEDFLNFWESISGLLNITDKITIYDNGNNINRLEVYIPIIEAIPLSQFQKPNSSENSDEEKKAPDAIKKFFSYVHIKMTFKYGNKTYIIDTTGDEVYNVFFPRSESENEVQKYWRIAMGVIIKEEEESLSRTRAAWLLGARYACSEGLPISTSALVEINKAPEKYPLYIKSFIKNDKEDIRSEEEWYKSAIFLGADVKIENINKDIIDYSKVEITENDEWARPLVSDAFFRLGNLNYKNNQLECASNKWEIAYKLNNMNANAAFMMGQIYEKMPDITAANECYKNVIKGMESTTECQRPDKVAALYSAFYIAVWERFHNSDKNYKDIILLLEDAREYKKNLFVEYTIYNQNSEVLRVPPAGNFAMPKFNNTIEDLDNKTSRLLARFYYEYGNELWDKNKPDEAVSYWEKADGLNHSIAPFELGCYYFDKKDYTKAIKYWEKAEKEVESCPLAMYCQAFCYESPKPLGVLRNYDKATELYQKAVNREGGTCYTDTIQYGDGNRYGPKKNIWSTHLGQITFEQAKNALSRIQYMCDEYEKGLNCRNKGHLRNVFNHFQLAEQWGHIEAKHQIGRCYRDGEGVPKDMRAAIDWFEHARKAGCHEIETENSVQLYEAYRELGSRLYEGRDGEPKDYDEGDKWLLKALSSSSGLPKEVQDKVNACREETLKCLYNLYYNLGIQYLTGRQGAPRNYDEAFRWLEKAVQEPKSFGDILDSYNLIKSTQDKAKYQLALCYYEGIGKNKNPKRAFDLFWNLANNSDLSEPGYYVARLYEQKITELETQRSNASPLEKRELSEKIDEYQELSKQYDLNSANKGYSEAQYIVGIRTLNGEKSYERGFRNGVEWLQKAARQEHAEAFFILGKWVQMDKKVLLSLQKQLSNQDYLYLTTPQRFNKENWGRFFLESAKRGSRTAQYEYGRCQYEGIGGYEQNYWIAADWTNKAALRNPYRPKDSNKENQTPDQYYDAGISSKRNMEEYNIEQALRLIDNLITCYNPNDEEKRSAVRYANDKENVAAACYTNVISEACFEMGWHWNTGKGMIPEMIPKECSDQLLKDLYYSDYHKAWFWMNKAKESKHREAESLTNKLEEDYPDLKKTELSIMNQK